jgi:hypothetical protein
MHGLISGNNSLIAFMAEDQRNISGTCIIYVRFCGIVVRVPGYKFRGPGSIPAATRLSEK